MRRRSNAMRRLVLGIVVTLACGAGCSGVASTPRPIVAAPPTPGRPTIAPMLDRVLPGVVNISAVARTTNGYHRPYRAHRQLFYYIQK